jgi:hypothetical protein
LDISPVLTDLPIHLPPLLRSPRTLTALGFGFAVAAGFTSYLLTRKRITEAEREHLRRNHLAHIGRITDGSITETQWLVPAPTESAPTTPAILLYRYRIAGVTYECAQDVTHLPEYVRQVRVDLPIQVRFDPRNPSNSIVVAESWSGLRLHASRTDLPAATEITSSQSDLLPH